MLWFRIAKDVLHCTIDEAQERMSSAEFTYWAQYAIKEPFGYDMDNYRAFVVAATVANVAPRKKGTKALQPNDFAPKRQQQKKISQKLEAELKERRKKRNG